MEAFPNDFCEFDERFHKEIPRAYIAAVFDTMEQADWHTYQVLTKRSSLLQRFLNERYRDRSAPAHMWFGVTVENEQAAPYDVSSVALRMLLSAFLKANEV